MISPCRSCSLEYVDKNNDTCLRCAKRIEYVASLEGRSCSVPVEMTDMAISRLSMEKVKEHDEFILSHPDMKPADVAKQLGRSTAAIYSRKFALGLTKKNRDVATRPDTKQPASVDDQQEAPPAAQQNPKAAEVVRQQDMMLVNLKGFEDLYDRLKQSAQRNFRTPELQAMWFIHQGLAAENGAGDNRRAPDGAA